MIDMNKEKDIATDNTEEKIRAAAKKLFTEKGLANTTVREVAEEAGVNIALLNYYFRSKDKLFMSIFAESFHEYRNKILDAMFHEDLPLEERIRKFVNIATDQLKKNPDLPMFISNECKQNPEAFKSVIKMKKDQVINSNLIKQLKEEAAKGNIREIDPLQFHFLVSSNVTAPFLSYPMMKVLCEIENISMDEFLEERKEIIVEMIMAYLKKKD